MQKQIKSQQLKIVLIGSGNIATHLGKALIKRGFVITQVFSKTLANSKKLGTELDVPYSNNFKQLNTTADIYFLCVKDDVLHSFLNKVDLKNSFLVHTSGSTPINLLKPYSKKIGVFYPLQTFNKEQKTKFKDVPLLIEANTITNRNILLEIANKLSSNVQLVNSEQRRQLHLAAVFACNFTNHLFTIAEKICIENNIDFNLLKPLIKQTAKRIEDNSPAHLQTGPAARKDYKIIEMQKELLQNNPLLLDLYTLFTEDIINRGKDS